MAAIHAAALKRLGRVSGRAAALGCLAAVALCLLAGRALAEARTALVVGNSKYASNPLANPGNDAEAIAKALTSVGFSVTKLVDADAATFRRAIVTFGRTLRTTEGVGLFYYAGHGVQIDGENYLIPVAADIQQARDAIAEGISLGEVLRTMDSAANRINIVVLDACRNNPYSSGTRGAQGLAPVSAPAGTLIAFSTAPGTVALDGDGGRSPYSAALAEMIPASGIVLEEVFRQTRRRVLAATEGRQTPWEHSSLTREFHFRPKEAMPETSARPIAGADPSSRDLEEIRAWEKVKASGSAALIRRHLESYPNGVFAELARYKLDQLRAHASNDEGFAGWLGTILKPEPGDPEAERLLEEGVKLEARGEPGSLSEAFQRYRTAADRGLPAAMHRLARAYDRGLGVTRDLPAAAEWYRRAAELGSAPSMAALGTMHEFGEGVAQSMAEALRLYRLAAEAGDTNGMTNLAYLHQLGKGVAQDPVEARRWYGLAADQGQARAMFNLALMHLRGEGGPADPSAAARLLAGAADKGHAGAMRELALLNDTGRGTPRDPRAAARWLLAAFKAGNTEARMDLFVRSGKWSPETRREVRRHLSESGQPTGGPGSAIDGRTRRALDAFAARP
ncbi:MAG TPA: caspase family protein [Hyphomicrobiaceae bacterium]|nr:caspase family protein [Hyphomicrobiaceae bacterium]